MMRRRTVRLTLLFLAVALVNIPAVAAQAAKEPERLTKTPELPDDAEPIELAPEFKLLYWNLRGPDRTGQFSLTGEARWDGESRIDAPGLVAVLKDKDGNILGTETVYPLQFVAEPGKRIAYDLEIYGMDGVSLIQVESVEWRACSDFGGTFWIDEWGSEFSGQVSIANVEVNEAKTDRLELVVDVRNDGAEPIQSAAAAVLLYDENRRLLQADEATVGAELPPGKFGRVRLTAIPREVVSTYFYRIVTFQRAFANMFFC